MAGAELPPRLCLVSLPAQSLALGWGSAPSARLIKGLVYIESREKQKTTRGEREREGGRRQTEKGGY